MPCQGERWCLSTLWDHQHTQTVQLSHGVACCVRRCEVSVQSKQLCLREPHFFACELSMPLAAESKKEQKYNNWHSRSSGCVF